VVASSVAGGRGGGGGTADVEVEMEEGEEEEGTKDWGMTGWEGKETVPLTPPPG
jgi:hypothetical protein